MVANQGKEKLDSLTIVRFIAAFAVFLLHGGMAFANNPATPTWFKNIISHGGEGVTIFFVLSGFILAYTYRAKIANRKFDFKNYLVNRFARVYPVYLVALIIGIPFMIMHAKFLGIHYSASFLAADSAARFSLLHAWYPYFNSHPHWLTQGWTLSVELLFYVSFPFLIHAIETKRQNVVAIWLVCIGLSWLPRMLIMRQFGDPGIDFVQQFPPLRVPEFAVGICSFYLYDNLKENKMALRAMKSVAIVALFVIFSQSFKYAESVLSLLTVAAASLLIIGLAGDRSTGKEGRLHRTMVFLGEASYSMYLMHGFVIVLGFKVMDRVLHTNSENSFLAFGICLAVTIGISALCYRFIEEPARIWIRSKQTKTTETIQVDTNQNPLRKSA